MFENNRGTNWNFPTWEQEQEMKRMAEIQARTFQDAAQKSAQQAADRARRAQQAGVQEGLAGLNPMADYIKNAVTSAPDYEAKRQQQLRKAQEMQNKGGMSAAFGAILEAFCK